MRIHFIAIGGSAMHNLALALHEAGHEISGSDDVIFEPSKSRLAAVGLLPLEMGWQPENIHSDIDVIVLGMHAKPGNPELEKAQELGLKVYSYPEFLYEHSKHKTRVVIGGSHGKTTITSMILHVMHYHEKEIDFMVGAQLDGFDKMVHLTEENDFMLLEGDEYLSSPIDAQSKFLHYKPHIALLSGIAWDHINVFPTFKNYINQFDIFCSLIERDGMLIYNDEDFEVKQLGEKYNSTLKTQAYSTPKFEPIKNGSKLKFNDKSYDLQIFGSHNLQNLIGAMHLAAEVHISNHDFLNAMSDFTGAGKRLQKVV
ncbi:MAG: Mur ligase family protein, partial [Flavobacteriaceae bacterium]|nr:Mur ligase family protein [Flavobacteriaceae bacterium]